jgi:hypothetical protein
VVYSLNHDPSFEIRFDSLDFFGSFFHQVYPVLFRACPEQRSESGEKMNKKKQR